MKRERTRAHAGILCDAQTAILIRTRQDRACPPTNESAESERLERVSVQSRVLKADYRIGSFSSTPRDVDGGIRWTEEFYSGLVRKQHRTKKNTLLVDLFLFYVTGWKYAVDADRFTHTEEEEKVCGFV